MATIILSVIIFGSASYIIYLNYFAKNRQKSCEACDCPAKAKARQSFGPTK